jgi:hypothetical protein
MVGRFMGEISELLLASMVLDEWMDWIQDKESTLATARDADAASQVVITYRRATRDYLCESPILRCSG